MRMETKLKRTTDKLVKSMETCGLKFLRGVPLLLNVSKPLGVDTTILEMDPLDSPTPSIGLFLMVEMKIVFVRTTVIVS
jgi:hypothetical protein